MGSHIQLTETSQKEGAHLGVLSTRAGPGRDSLFHRTGVNLKGVGPASVIWSKAHGHAKKPKYIATSDLRMKPREIIQWYAKRWSIEVWHRDMKQNYGYGDCHCRKFAAVEAHIQLSLCAYLLQKLAKKEALTLERYLRKRDLNKITLEFTRFPTVRRLKTLIYQAREDVAA